MLAQATITPVIHVEDLARARRFYADVLGLREDTQPTDPEAAAFTTDRGRLELLRRPNAISRDATALSFEVDDVAREVADLSARGARFESVDLLGARREGYVSVIGDDGERAAWLKDSEGNWLCVHSR